jgi:hypothetical protein
MRTPVLQVGHSSGLVPKSRSNATIQLVSFSRGAGGGAASEVLAPFRREDSVMPDADEARGQDVLGGEPGEDRPADCAVFGHVPFGAVFVAEGDAVAVVAGDPGVSGGDAVDVSGQVPDDVAGSGEGSLGVDVPRFRGAAERVQVLREVGEDVTLLERALDLGEKRAAEELAERLDRQEEPPRRRYPSRAVEGETPGGDDAVEVRMESKLLVPGVQDGGESDGRLELGPGDVDERLGSCEAPICSGFVSFIPCWAARPLPRPVLR